MRDIWDVEIEKFIIIQPPKRGPLEISTAFISTSDILDWTATRDMWDGTTVGPQRDVDHYKMGTDFIPTSDISDWTATREKKERGKDGKVLCPFLLLKPLPSHAFPPPCTYDAWMTHDSYVCMTCQLYHVWMTHHSYIRMNHASFMCHACRVATTHRML